MDMDSRQKQIQSGAGLEEAKYNLEFIDFLKRWGTPILLVVAILSMGSFFYRRYQERVAQQTDVAWVEFEDARVARNPAGLLAVAEAHAGEVGVPQQARLAAADAMYISAVQGVKPGGLNPQGELNSPDVLLTAEGKMEQLNAAIEQYTRVARELEGKRHMVQLRLEGLFGAAAALETLGKYDEAKATLATAAKAAEAGDFPAQAAVARKRIETMEEAKTAPRLYASSEVKTKRPPPPPPPAPDAMPATLPAIQPIDPRGVGGATPNATGGVDLNLPAGSGTSLEPTSPIQIVPPGAPAAAPAAAPGATPGAAPTPAPGTTPPATTPPATTPPASTPKADETAKPAPAPATVPPAPAPAPAETKPKS